jgi:hypothetical protein
MTVLLDKKQIHLGWQTAAAIIIFLIGTMWGAGDFTAKYLQKQDEIYKAVMYSKREDSIQDVRLDTITMWHTRGTSERNNIKADINYILGALKVSGPAVGFYTEKKVNGRIVLERVKK